MLTGAGARPHLPRGTRRRVFALYRHRCAHCGRTLNQLLAMGRRLHVHHKDGDATNNGIRNLQVLCSPGCHEDAHRGR